MQTASKFGTVSLGDLISQGISVIAPIAVGAIHGGGSSATHTPCSGPYPIHGQGSIAGCIDSLIAQITIAENQGTAPAQLVQLGQTILAQLNNPQTFTQGDAYLIQAQTDIAGWIRTWQAQAAAGITGTQSVLDANGNIVTVPIVAPAQIIAGVSNVYLIGGAVLLVGLLSMRRG